MLLRILTALYTRYAPNKLQDIEGLLQDFTGRVSTRVEEPLLEFPNTLGDGFIDMRCLQSFVRYVGD